MRRPKQAYFGSIVGGLDFFRDGISLNNKRHNRHDRVKRSEWETYSEFFFGSALLLALTAKNDHPDAEHQEYACHNLNGFRSHVVVLFSTYTLRAGLLLQHIDEFFDRGSALIKHCLLLGAKLNSIDLLNAART
jgi:hypothetical protein